MSFADYVNLGLVITALFAVYYQARAVRISERELELQVKDVQTLVERLDTERKEREAQLASMIRQIASEQAARQVERDERLNDYVELLEYSSSSYATAQKIGRGARQLADKDITTLSHCMFVLTHPSTHFADDRTLYEQRFSVVRRNLAALLELIDIHSKFDEAMACASTEYERRKQADSDSKNLAHNLGRFESDVDKAGEEMGASTAKAGAANQPVYAALEKLVRELASI